MWKQWTQLFWDELRFSFVFFFNFFFFILSLIPYVFISPFLKIDNLIFCLTALWSFCFILVLLLIILFLLQLSSSFFFFWVLLVHFSNFHSLLSLSLCRTLPSLSLFVTLFPQSTLFSLLSLFCFYFFCGVTFFCFSFHMCILFNKSQKSNNV